MTVLSQVFPFIHPALAGLALASGSIPILIHLINKKRFQRVNWAAMSFLFAAHQRSARRVKLEHWLLLALRVAVIILLGLALARPYLPASSLLGLGTTRSHHVLLIDNSRSMNADNGAGGTRFDDALTFARSLVDSFRRGDAISIVTLARPAEAIIQRPSYDRRFVRERLDSIHATQRATDTLGGLSLAIEIVEGSELPSGNRSAFLISDLPARQWEVDGDRAPTPVVAAARRLADAARLTAIRTGAGPTDNVAVTRLEPTERIIGTTNPIRIEVEVSNFGEASVRNLTLRLQRDGQILRTEAVPVIEAGQSVVISVPVVLPSVGTHGIEARLLSDSQDPLDDDRRSLSVEARRAVPVLLVDGRPGVSVFKGQAGYLATALAPKENVTDVTLLDPKTISEWELPGEILSEYDVAALCNVGRLPEDQWGRLEQFVSDGGALLIFAGDLVSVENYNRFGYADGEGLIPGVLSRPQTTNDPESFITLQSDALNHPLVEEYSGQAQSGLFQARFERYIPIEVDESKAEIPLRFSDASPALVLFRYGQGQVAFFASTANMDWNNLPSKGDYVSLMNKLVDRIAPRSGGRRNLEVGQILTEPLTPAQSSMELRVTTKDRSESPRLVPKEDGLALQYGPIDAPGLLTVTIGPNSMRFAANVDSADSDLRSVDRSAFERAVPQVSRFVADTGAAASEPITARSSEMSAPLLYAVIVLLFIEAFAAMRFGIRRGGSESPRTRRGIRRRQEEGS